MHAVRRTLAAAAAPLLLVALAACGGSEEPVATEEAPAGESTGAEATEDEPSEEATTEATEDETTAEEVTGQETSGASDAPDPATTAVEHLWVDDSWEIEEVEDLCGEMEPSPAPYSDQEGFFTCGPNAASALACQVEAENLVRCITNAPGRSAISFASDKAAESAGALPANEEALPIQVTLPGDVTCEPLSHDHGRHYEGMFSWYACSDGSELLTDEDIQNTFAVVGETWTVQQSVDQGAPEEVVAETVTFAGT